MTGLKSRESRAQVYGLWSNKHLYKLDVRTVS